jgi:hypothetical protein
MNRNPDPRRQTSGKLGGQATRKAAQRTRQSERFRAPTMSSLLAPNSYENSAPPAFGFTTSFLNPYSHLAEMNTYAQHENPLTPRFFDLRSHPTSHSSVSPQLTSTMSSPFLSCGADVPTCARELNAPMDDLCQQNCAYFPLCIGLSEGGSEGSVSQLGHDGVFSDLGNLSSPFIESMQP